MGLFSKKKHHTAGQVDENRLPRHIAVIMDGNGRWAKRRGLPRTAGHKVGAEVFRKIATHCKELGVEYLTVYAFSTENWKRPADEVNTIMGLLKQYMLEAIDSMERDQIRLRFLGDLSAISPELQALVDRTNEISSHIHGFQANVCLNYGGRDELVWATRQLADMVKAGTLLPEEIDDLEIVEGEDLCTLVTCTPYGINTHRLLVRGHRVANQEDAENIRVTAEAMQVDTRIVAAFVAVPILLVLLIWLLVSTRKKR